MTSRRFSTALGFLLVLLSAVGAYAQSNERIDELLSQAQAHLDSAAYIVLAAGGLINESDDLATAFAKARELGLAKESSTPESPVRVDELSLMLMKSLAIKGGLLYSIFPGKRYAYRELVFQKAVNGSGGPARLVSGEEVIRSLGYASRLGGDK